MELIILAVFGALIWINQTLILANRDCAKKNKALIQAIQCCCNILDQHNIEKLANHLYDPVKNPVGSMSSNPKREYTMNQPENFNKQEAQEKAIIKETQQPFNDVFANPSQAAWVKYLVEDLEAANENH